MTFWIRNLILGLFLATLAWGFFANQELLMSLTGSLEGEEKSPEVKTPVAQTSPSAVVNEPVKETKKRKPEKYQQGRTTTNAAALGLSRFYANLHGDMNGKGPKIRNNIVYLPDPKGDLVKILQAREVVVRPYKKTWQGRKESRPFRKGETLNQKLSEYSDQDGISLIWWLNRDYVIKDPFRIEKTLLKTSIDVAKAVEGHFQSGLSIFFCNRQRAIVIIESAPHPYLDDECIFLKRDSGY